MHILREVAKSQTDDALVLVRDFPGYVAGEEVDTYFEVVVQCVLDNTAVVYPPGEVWSKKVVNLSLISVRDEDIKWVPRNPRELAQMRARQIGRERGRLAQDAKAA